MSPAVPSSPITVGPFQFIDASLLVTQDPPAFSDDLHRGAGPAL